MDLHEPMTLLTDYALGLLCAVLAIRLFRAGSDPSRSCWAAALAICAVSAFAGGTYHGFLPVLDDVEADLLWTATLMSIGCAAFFGTVATARAHLHATWRRRIELVAVLQLAVYLFATTRTADFLIAIVDYSVSFGFVLVVHAAVWLRTRNVPAAWIVAGVMVSFLAAGIQAAGIAPHPAFNHNDLYHVVQMLGMWMLYKGAAGTAVRT